MGRIVVNGLSGVRKKLNRVAQFNRLQMNVVSEMAKKDVLDHFNKEQGPTGRWKPTKKGKGKILQDTGRLKSSIKGKSSSRKAEVSTNVSYAGVHNFGSSGRNIPKRKFLWISQKAKIIIAKFIASRIVKA